jgi:hypothetical protein
MTPLDIIALCHDAGIGLHIAPTGKLRFRAQPGCFTPELRALVRENMDAIIEALPRVATRGHVEQACCNCAATGMTIYLEDERGAWWCRACAVLVGMVQEAESEAKS